MNAFGAPLIRFCFLGAFSIWLLDNWAEIALGSLAGARQAIALVIPGYQGPSQLFEAGSAIVSRIALQDVAWSWNPGAMAIGGIFLGMSMILIWLGFAIVSLVAVLAEVQLLIAAAVGPFVLPFMALGIVSSIGLGAVRFLLVSFVRTVALGVLCSVMIQAVVANMSVAGVGDVMTTLEITQLLSLSLLCAVFSVGAGGIANGMIGHLGGGGAMGYSSIQHASSVTSSAINSTSKVGQAGMAAAGGMASGFAQSAGAMGRAAGKISRAVNNGKGPFGNN
jgi:hypothetical protein